MSEHDRVLGDRYRLGGLVDGTGDRTVHAAVDEWSDRPVVMTLVPMPPGSDAAGALRRTVGREVATASGIRNRHLGQVLGAAGDGNAGLWVAAETGGGFRTLAALGEPPAPGRVARWGRDIADGLAALHAAGLVHRAVRPEFVAVRDDDGSAFLIAVGATADLATGDDDPAADVRALAAALRSLLPSSAEAGSSPEDRAAAANLGAVLEAVGSGTVVPASEFRDELARSVAGQPTTAAPASEPAAAEGRATPASGQEAAQQEPGQGTAQREPGQLPEKTELITRRSSSPWARPAAGGTACPASPPAGEGSVPPSGQGAGHPPMAPPPEAGPGAPPPRWAANANPSGHHSGPQAPAWAYLPSSPPPGAPSDATVVTSRPGRSRAGRWWLVGGAAALVMVVVAAALWGGALLPPAGTEQAAATSSPTPSPTHTPTPSPAPTTAWVTGPLGDPATADPCSLVSASDYRKFGKPTLADDFGSFSSCFLAIEKGDALIVVRAMLYAPGEGSPITPSGRPGDLAINESAPEGSTCERQIGLADGHQVVIRVDGENEPGAEMCRIADVGTATAARVLEAHSVARRVPDSSSVLFDIDMCELSKQAAGGSIAGLDTSRIRAGVGNHSCWVGVDPAFRDVASVLVTALRMGPLTGTPVKIGRHSAVVTEYPSSDPRASCGVEITQRTYTGTSGNRRVETVEIIFEGAPRVPVKQVCSQARSFATLIEPGLPAPS